MKIFTGLQTNELQTVSDQVLRAEGLGFDGVATGETNSTPFLPIVLAAEHSRNLQLMTSVAIAFPRSPFVTAQTAWELQKFSNGRFILGLGTQVRGHNARRFSSLWDPPGPRMRDYIRCIRAVWESFQNGTEPTYQGDFYTFTLLPPFFSSGPIKTPPPPVHVAAVNRYMLEFAGEECDGVSLHSFNTLKYTEEVVLPSLEAGARKNNRKLSEIAIEGGGFIVSGRDHEEVERKREALKQQIAFYASTRSYKPVMDMHGWGGVVETLYDLSRKGGWSQMGELITDEMVDSFATCGTYDEIAPMLKKRYGNINSSISISLAGTDTADDDKLKSILETLHR